MHASNSSSSTLRVPDRPGRHQRRRPGMPAAFGPIRPPWRTQGWGSGEHDGSGCVGAGECPAGRRVCTSALQPLLHHLLADDDQETYAARIHTATGIPFNTVYKQLKRLEAAGWLTSRLESRAERPGSARRRTYYSLTAAAQRAAARIPATPTTSAYAPAARPPVEPVDTSMPGNFVEPAPCNRVG